MFQKMFLIMIACIATLFSIGVFALNDKQISEKKRTESGLYLTSKEAYELISQHKAKILFLDVRTRAEVNFLGMPTVADANIPYMEIDSMYSWDNKKNVYKMEPNSNFLVEVEKRIAEKKLNKNDKIVLICRSGDRSAKAADLLTKAGYKTVYSVVDGYEGDQAKDGENRGQRVVNGWRNSKLPWTYELTKSRMYFE